MQKTAKSSKAIRANKRKARTEAETPMPGVRARPVRLFLLPHGCPSSRATATALASLSVRVVEAFSSMVAI